MPGMRAQWIMIVPTSLASSANEIRAFGIAAWIDARARASTSALDSGTRMASAIEATSHEACSRIDRVSASRTAAICAAAMPRRDVASSETARSTSSKEAPAHRHAPTRTTSIPAVRVERAFKLFPGERNHRARASVARLPQCEYTGASDRYSRSRACRREPIRSGETRR